MKVTMRDLADHFGVSINTVSLALNNKSGVSESLRREILKKANEWGYLTKKDKFRKTFRANNLCVMLPSHYANAVTGTDFYGSLLFGIIDEAKKHGYDTIVHVFDHLKFSVPSAVEHNMVSGMIVIGKTSEKSLKEISRFHFPVVLADHASFNGTYNCVLSDNKVGGYLATQYLLEQGFRTIGFFGDLQYSLSIKERYFGYQEAMQQFYSMNQLSDCHKVMQSFSLSDNIEQYVLTRNQEAVVKLLQEMTLPEAFVCSNDHAAILLGQALLSLGYRIPQDVSIVGFDNVHASGLFQPPLTTVEIDSDRIGRVCVQKLKQLIQNPNRTPEQTVLPVKLIERQSVRLST